MNEWFCSVGTTSSLVLDCEGFNGFADFFILDNGACLGHIMTLGADFAVLPVLLVFFTILCVGVK
jgi:hypothetical protein